MVVFQEIIKIFQSIKLMFDNLLKCLYRCRTYILNQIFQSRQSGPFGAMIDTQEATSSKGGYEVIV